MATKKELLLHNIRSAHNVGALFRTAEGAGVTRIHLSGYTPIPLDRYGRPQKEIAKTALGAEHLVPWEYHKTPSALMKHFKKEGGMIVGVEQDARAKEYRTLRLTKPALILVGNEVRGLSPALRRACDVLIEIPMRGKKESLNVSVAAGIVLFSL